MNIIKKLFHRCDMKTIETHSNINKGEIWIQQCKKCGRKQRVIFDSKGKCLDIKDI